MRYVTFFGSSLATDQCEPTNTPPILLLGTLSPSDRDKRLGGNWSGVCLYALQWEETKPEAGKGREGERGWAGEKTGSYEKVLAGKALMTHRPIFIWATTKKIGREMPELYHYYQEV